MLARLTLAAFVGQCVRITTGGTMTITRHFQALAAIAAVAFVLPVRADYVCRLIDIPGAGFTQPFEFNNAGQLVAGSDLGGYIYSAGAWQPLPAAPAGFTAPGMAPTGLNDYGTVAGIGYPSSGGPEQSYVLTGGAYSFYSYPSTTLVNTEARAINSHGIVTGIAYDGSGTVFNNVGFVYNPGAAPGYAKGFTEIVPTLNGQRSVLTIIQQMNDAGQFVGSGRFPGHGVWGFVYDPAGSPPMSFFRVSTGAPTRARAINNRGQIAGAVPNASGGFAGFMRDSAGDHYFDCPELNVFSFFPNSMNDHGIISGGTQDANFNSVHGFIAYPSVGAEIADLQSAVSGVGPGRSLEAKMDGVAASNAAGNTAGACSGLSDFLAEVKAQTGKMIPAETAASFTAEANSIAQALGCK